MASRYFNQFMSTLRFGLRFVEGTFQIGASGGVVANSFTGGGISASSNVTVQKLATGIYRLQLQDPYFRLVGVHLDPIAPTSVYSSASSAYVTDGNLIVGVPYQIVGGTSANNSQYPSSGQAPLQPSTSTNWYQLGLYPGVNPAIGQTFVATSGGSQVPGSSAALGGQGQVARVITTGITALEILPGINTQLSPTSASSGVQGTVILFQVIGGASSALVPVNPPQNTWIRYNLFLDNSSRLQYNEASTSN